MVALSVDGSFSATDDTTSADMIFRLHDESVINTAYRYLFHCNDAFKAEIHMMMEDVAFVIQHTELIVLVQLDSSMALSIFVDIHWIDLASFGDGLDG